jgi:hypothetical protein
MSARQSPRRASILAELAVRPMHIREICEATKHDYNQLADVISHLRASGQIVVLGHCGEQGIKHMRKDAPIYGLPGMKLLQREKSPRTRHGSGTIAAVITIGRGYRWGSR